ncbi:alginate production protein|uniref:Alginate export protein n=2 Tax=Brenneria salicis TaxID=55214 RepID=A0A366I003_9GAMM|nr:alginate production protein [Brenneria salicis ATCC 15712 = DSM 30166]RBP60136.1 alginate export protein [Brenneria salicis ATCC 15712 = DSM 30166]
MIRHCLIFPFLSLLPLTAQAAMSGAATQAEREERKQWVTIKPRLILEGKHQRNKKLRQGEKKDNATELEPALRLHLQMMKDAPLSGLAELEWIKKIERESREAQQQTTSLNLNQAYVKISDEIIPNTELRLGRWLMRDEREWLFDENLDGVHARFSKGNIEVDAVAGRVNHWQKDLFDGKTKQDPVNTGGILARYYLDDNWRLGLYSVIQRDITTDNNRQINTGIRSHAFPKQGLQHWFEFGVMQGREASQRLRGYAVDAGGTYIFDSTPLRPRITLGYAWGSGDGNQADNIDKGYRQTGLHSNEARSGGIIKYKIYGSTFNPELTNIHILTGGIGINLAPEASLDLVYHDYRQDQLASLGEDSTELSPRYDRLSTKHLGSAVELMFGCRPDDNIEVESIFGWFMPSSRFRQNDSQHSEASEPDAYLSLNIEVGF